MNDPNATYWYARLISEQVKEAGVAAVVLCPGNRNAPLLFSLKNAFPDNYYVHIDERSAAFMALGLAKSLKKPVAICMTSGSAVANVLPALTEAYASGIPLIILSADRPDFLHDSGAPQCMTQQHIFKDFVGDSLHLAIDHPDKEKVSLALTQLRNTLHSQNTARPLPLHINITFNDPLAPTVDPEFIADNDIMLTEISDPVNFTSSEIPDAILQQIKGAKRGLIVCGPDAPLSDETLIQLAQNTSFPVIADAASNYRRENIPNLICTADLLVQGSLGKEDCDVLIRVGAAPINRPLYEYCARQKCPIIRIDNHEVRKDFLHEQFFCLSQPDTACLESLGDVCDGSQKWLQQWLDAETNCLNAIKQFTTQTEWGECTAAAQILQHPFEQLQLANSMAIRHANIFCFASDTEIISHRGVNGIDGTLGSFIGLNLASSKNSALLCGDIAFFHDTPALHAAKHIQHPAIIFVLNNHGGHIFDLLPIAGETDISELLHTEQNCHVDDLAKAFGIQYTQTNNSDELTHAIDAHLKTPALSIIEINVPANSLAQQLASFKDACII